MTKEWFVIHTYSGYENKVKTNLEKRVESMNMEDYIFRVIVPMENEVQVKDGKKKVVQRKIFPGYVLVKMIMTDDSWYVVRNTTGVTGFVGTGAKPVPLKQAEIEHLLSQMATDESGEPGFKINFEIGENIRIKDGPFEGFLGRIEEIDAARGKVRVQVAMFGGRETTVEFDYPQIEKVTL